MIKDVPYISSREKLYPVKFKLAAGRELTRVVRELATITVKTCFKTTDTRAR